MTKRARPAEPSRLAPLPGFASLFVGLGAFALYAWQAPAVAGDKDSAELTLALAVQGVPHPTGYPLYILLGHPFVRAVHGLGASWALAANLWSAVGGAVAVGLLHALAARLVDAHEGRARGLVGLVPTVLFATNPVWTYDAVLAEVNSWHLAWVAAVTLVFTRALEQLEDDGPWNRTRGLRLAAGWGVLCGLGAAHHATSLLVAGPLTLGLVLAGRRRGRVDARVLGVGLVAALLPLSSLGFVAWRAFHPAAWQWPTLEPTWAGIVRHFRGGAYEHFLFHFAPGAEQRELLGRYVYPVLWPGLAAFGLLAGGTRRRSLFWPLLAAAALTTLFAFSYGVPDPSSYFLVPVALGLVGAVGAASEFPALRRAAGPVLAAGAIGVVGLGVAWSHTGLQRRLVFDAFEQRVRSMWAVLPDQPTLVLWPSDMAARLLLYKQLDREKPHVEVVNPLLLPSPPVRAAFQARHGIDPLEGVVVPAGVASGEARVWPYAEAVAARLNALSPRAVVLFDPERDSVRLLRKP